MQPHDERCPDRGVEAPFVRTTTIGCGSVGRLGDDGTARVVPVGPLLGRAIGGVDTCVNHRSKVVQWEDSVWLGGLATCTLASQIRRSVTREIPFRIIPRQATQDIWNVSLLVSACSPSLCRLVGGWALVVGRWWLGVGDRALVVGRWWLEASGQPDALHSPAHCPCTPGVLPVRPVCCQHDVRTICATEKAFGTESVVPPVAGFRRCRPE